MLDAPRTSEHGGPGCSTCAPAATAVEESDVNEELEGARDGQGEHARETAREGGFDVGGDGAADVGTPIGAEPSSPDNVAGAGCGSTDEEAGRGSPT